MRLAVASALVERVDERLRASARRRARGGRPPVGRRRSAASGKIASSPSPMNFSTSPPCCEDRRHLAVEIAVEQIDQLLRRQSLRQRREAAHVREPDDGADFLDEAAPDFAHEDALAGLAADIGVEQIRRGPPQRADFGDARQRRDDRFEIGELLRREAAGLPRRPGRDVDRAVGEHQRETPRSRSRPRHEAPAAGESRRDSPKSARWRRIGWRDGVDGHDRAAAVFVGFQDVVGGGRYLHAGIDLPDEARGRSRRDAAC